MSIVATSGRRRRDGADDGMIPMINIVFLLLVFFMIAGQIVPREAGLELPLSVSDAELAEQYVEVSIGADAAIRVDGEVVDGDLAGYLSGMFADDAGQGVEALTCHVHRTLPARVLDPVLRAARALNIPRLQIVTEWRP